jgi:hypothetical protein
MLLVWPVLAQVVLTLGLGVVLGTSRFGASRRREVKLREVALDNSAWPESVRKIGNNYANQFELPVLFYVLSGLAIYLGQDHLGMTAAAWGFVVSRFAHTAIHVGRNDILRRFQVFVLGVLFLVAMLLMLVAALIVPAS